ncbi:MAG: flagellar basal body L-ring protein FlgH [Proteobacteria bacterium]|nr:flagellar basal body L-ring protein FlgH [Pseudomonadota bacterium]
MMRASGWAALALIGSALAGPARADNLYKGGNWPAMASDRKASRVGDLLTIQVVANNSASNSVTQGTKKSTTAGAGLNASRSAGSSDLARSGGVDFAGQYDGQGTSGRANRMAAQLSATVGEVLPNGDMIVSGWQMLNISGEKTNIKVTGRVRQEDISADNAVLSSRLADARIEYDGKGFTSRGALPGVVTQIFSLLGIL